MKIEREDSRRQLLAAVRQRRSEIRQTVLTRVHAIGDADSDADTEYLEGLRSAVESALDHTIEAAAGSDDRPPPVPDPLLAQARLAARRRVPLETMLRRYLAGHALLGDFVSEEAERQGVSPGVLRSVLRAQALTTDQVVANISSVYLQEASLARWASVDGSRGERVRRLLGGELLDPSGLDYDLEIWHVGYVVKGPARRAAKYLAARVDCRSLVVESRDGQTWAWLGTRDEDKANRIGDAIASYLPDEDLAGIGEAAHGRAGWRLTHWQAREALSVAVRGQMSVARYADVALVAAAMKDEVLAASLRVLYLDPLEETRDGGETLRDTLRAYLSADRNVTSAAAALGVSRNTVTNRLRVIESKIGPLKPRLTGDLGLALQLDELTLSHRP